MITDKPPARGPLLIEYQKSDALPQIELPPAEMVRGATEAMFAAMAGGKPAPVRASAQALLDGLAGFYQVASPPLKVLGVRPHKVVEGRCTYELFGDYTPATQAIRVWMRTAIRGKVTSPRGLLNTLLHELCHHLDCVRFELPETFHTRGFYHRVDALYHHALATPSEARRPLHWVKTGGGWRIDWARSTTRKL